MHWKWRPQHPAVVASPGIHLIQQKVGNQKLWGGSAFLGNAETNVTYMMHGFDSERRDPKSSLEFHSEGSKQVIKQFPSMPNSKDWAIRSRLAWKSDGASCWQCLYPFQKKLCTHRLLRHVSFDKIKLIHSRAEGKRQVRGKQSLTESSISQKKILHIKS